MRFSSDIKPGKNVELLDSGGVLYLRFSHIHKTGLWAHGISTRIGGVSSGPYHSMNLGFTTEDSQENLRENRDIFSKALKIRTQPLSQLINLIHGNLVLDYSKIENKKLPVDADGIMTDRPGLPLITTFADCIPLILADPASKAIAVIHSGWRGTFAGIAKNAVAAMTEHYGSKPGDILAGIGPGIGRCCFETGKDVADAFFDKFAQWQDLIEPASNKDKWFVDLKGLSARILAGEGLNPDNISTADLCTCCREDLFFSYRRDGAGSGRMAAVARVF